MANQLASLPWVVDTPAADAIFTGHMKILRLAFTGYTDAGHSVEVQDGNGRIVAKLDGTTDFEEVEAIFCGWIQGMIIPVNQSAVFGGNPNLLSGVLTIMLE